jgi:class 3 adenylate cyclase/PAS domain-containing protein
MSESTVRLGTGEHLARLSRMAEDLRAQLAAYRERLGGRQRDFPSGVVESLRQLSGTLQGLRLSVDEMENERGRLASLAEVGRVVNSSLDLPTVLAEVIDTLTRITGAERAFLMMRDQGELRVMVARNWDRSSIGSGEEAFSRTIVERVERHGEPILTTNAQADSRFAGYESIIAYNLRSVLCVPLKVKGHLIGVLYADNRAREGLFSENDRNLLSAFADQAAVALENARLFASVEQTLEEVTRLKNLMEDVFASIASGVITSDVEDRISLCNRAAEGILARPASDLVGAPLGDFLPALSPDLLPRIAAVREKEERLIGLEIRPELEGRGRVDLSLSVTPLRSAAQVVQGVTLVLDDVTEKRRLEATRRLFERMVSPAVIDQLDPDSVQLGGRLEEITTLFADLQGFTALGETIGPEELVSVVNRYLAGAAEAILEQEGTIDKFLGDAIMAWFNAPIAQPDHWLRAARAALGVRAAAEALQREMPKAFRLQFRIGVHTGPAVLGLIGTESRVEYTAMGDSVNTAKRLQENAASGQILFSRRAIEPILHLVEAEHAQPLQVLGKREAIEVWELRGMAGRV